MARQRRVEYAGALYHVMARGDRREPIYLDDDDRQAFLALIGRMCDRAGMLVHAYVLMGNHYHLVLETPEANLVDGMRWLQNSYTRRFNVRHGLWGHVFGDRYKALVIDPQGSYFCRAVDYVHLNPVRAGLVAATDDLAAYPWCSLRAYVGSPRHRPSWLSVDRLLGSAFLTDTASGRAAYRRRLIALVTEDGHLSGVINRDAMPEQSLQATLRRGWYFGSDSFRASLLDRLAERAVDSSREKANGYHGSQWKDRGLATAHRLLDEGCRRHGLSLAALQERKANDPIKAELADEIARMTSLSLDWIRTQLRMGSRGHCSRIINDHRRAKAQKRKIK